MFIRFLKNKLIVFSAVLLFYSSLGLAMIGPVPVPAATTLIGLVGDVALAYELGEVVSILASHAKATLPTGNVVFINTPKEKSATLYKTLDDGKPAALKIVFDAKGNYKNFELSNKIYVDDPSIPLIGRPEKRTGVTSHDRSAILETTYAPSAHAPAKSSVRDEAKAAAVSETIFMPVFRNPYKMVHNSKYMVRILI